MLKLTMARPTNKAILVVMTVPRDQNTWTSTDHEATTIRHTCYWVNLEGDPMPAATKPQVSVPTANILNAAVLSRLLDLVDEGRPLPK